jgi:hypothetical protein
MPSTEFISGPGDQSIASAGNSVPSAKSGIASHRLYIWRSDDRNPRLVTIQATDNQPADTVEMAQLFERFLAGIAVPATPRGDRGVATSTVHLDSLTLTSQFYQQVKDSTPIVEIADPNLQLPDDIHSGQIKLAERIQHQREIPGAVGLQICVTPTDVPGSAFQKLGACSFGGSCSAQ